MQYVGYLGVFSEIMMQSPDPKALIGKTGGGRNHCRSVLPTRYSKCRETEEDGSRLLSRRTVARNAWNRNGSRELSTMSYSAN